MYPTIETHLRAMMLGQLRSGRAEDVASIPKR